MGCLDVRTARSSLRRTGFVCMYCSTRSKAIIPCSTSGFRYLQYARWTVRTNGLKRSIPPALAHKTTLSFLRSPSTTGGRPNTFMYTCTALFMTLAQTPVISHWPRFVVDFHGVRPRFFSFVFQDGKQCPHSVAVIDSGFAFDMSNSSIYSSKGSTSPSRAMWMTLCDLRWRLPWRCGASASLFLFFLVFRTTGESKSDDDVFFFFFFFCFFFFERTGESKSDDEAAVNFNFFFETAVGGRGTAFLPLLHVGGRGGGLPPFIP